METVYLETTFISYLVSLPSRDLLVAAHQQVTADWWTHRRSKYECFVSEIVVDYLLTWNCKHIANAHILKKVETVCSQAGYTIPVICTPEELMEGEL